MWVLYVIKNSGVYRAFSYGDDQRAEEDIFRIKAYYLSIGDCAFAFKIKPKKNAICPTTP